MIHWGFNALNHGSSLAVFKNSKYISCISSNEDELPASIIESALEHGEPNRVYWYENPWVKKARQLYAGQYDRAIDMSVLPKQMLKKYNITAPLTYTPHHGSHAAAGYYTSPFNHCAIVVLDAIGEFECASIWEGKHGDIKKVWSRSYPNSLGLFYSAFTKLLGLTPIQDEYKLQQMAINGDPTVFRARISKYFNSGPVELMYNFHKGVLDWKPYLHDTQIKYDIAAAVQERFEVEVGKVMRTAQMITNADSLVYMGGCAMNSEANKNEVEPRFKYIWSLPNPGDPSSAIGSVTYYTKFRVFNDWGTVNHIDIRT
jgi:carbamoyltransferase